MIETFKKYVKAYPLYAYLREGAIINDVEELIKNSEDLTFLNEKYNEYVLKMNKERDAQSKCDSDFFWWGHEADVEKYKYLSEFVKRLIVEKFDINTLPENKKLEKKATEFDKIISKIDEKINGLKEFKPASYKAKIELLENVKKAI